MTDLRTTLQASLGSAYTLEQELSGGGMSRVFVAHDTRLKRRVVVKVLSPELASGLSTGRFEREISLAASLQQANIVPVLDAGEIDGLPYYTMPFIEGRSLRARLADGAVTVVEVVSVLKDVARALAYAHERGIVHRDIKPDNVLLSGGTAVVTDFGIAKAISASMTAPPAQDATGALTQLGTALGTPAYMAPEQIAADPNIDHRADLYAFGCLAYELLTSRPPFQGLAGQRLLAAQLSENPKPVDAVRADTPNALAALVMQCLEKDADRRPPHAADVLRALDAVNSQSSTTLPRAPLGRQISLGSVVGIWASVFVATFVLAKAAIVGIGLPGWVLPAALVLAALGLPAMLFTHYVQRSARAVQVAPYVTWRRTGGAGGVVAGAFAATVAVLMGLRALGVGPTASLFSKGVLDRNDRVIVAQVSMHGGDTTLAGTLTEALREDLAQSHTITLLPPSGVREALARMERPPESMLTPELAREIAQRGVAKLIIASDIVPLGAGYVVTAKLIDPAKGDPLRSFTETARDASDVIAAVSRVAKDVRAGIGESLRSVQGSARLEQVTTSSLEAYRKYRQAIELTEGTRLDVERARALLLDAVRLDSTFAMAYLELVWLDPDPQRAAAYAIEAHQFREHLSPVERNLADGWYYWAAVNDVDRALSATTDAYHADSLNPHVLTAMSAIYYWGRRDPRQALVWAERAAKVDSVVAQDYLIWPLMSLRRFPEAERLLERAAAMRGSSDSRMAFYTINLLWAEGKYDSIPDAVVRAHNVSSDPWTDMMTPGFQGMLGTMRGQLEAGGRRMAEWIDAARKIGFPLTEMDEVLQLTRYDVWQRERPQGIRRLDSAVARFRFDSLPPGSRPYLDIADLYSQAKRPDEAKRWLARYDAEAKDSLQRRRDLPSKHRSLGYLAISEGRGRDAVAEFRRSLAAGSQCAQSALGGIGLAFDAAGQLDSVQTTYERYLGTFSGTCTMGNDAMWRPLILKRLGELYEQKGDRATAAGYYHQFVDLWKNADPDLQPKVAEVKQRLAHLSDGEKR